MPETPTSVTIGPWVVDAYPNETRAIYSQIKDGAEECDCEHCQHWAANRAATYPPGALALFQSLGIDHRREAEVYQAGPMPEDHTCSGWFQFVGRVVSGPPDPTTWGFPTEYPLTDEGFQVLVRRAALPMKKPMQDAYAAGRPIVALEFFTNLHRIPSELS
jgi:hypothetical protein